MGLFSPWFLAGLLALGLPLWLHLLRQFKRTPQPFSSLMFFERQIQSSSKHRRLRYITLLLMRLALLALLALLFANPFINRASNAAVPRKLNVVVVDHSFSMRYKDRFADAKSQAVQFLRQLPPGQNTQIFALDSHLAQINSLDALEAGDEASSYGEFTRALRVMEQTTGLSLNVHLFTDAQQSSMPAAFNDLQLGPHTQLTIHEIGKGDSPNWAIQSVGVPARVYDASNLRLTASVAGWQTSAASRKVTVSLDGHSLASKDVAIPASGQTEIEFKDLVIPYGIHKGDVRMEPHDDLPNDDAMSFSIEHADPRKVLFLTTPGRSAESFFYKSALDSSTATGLRVETYAITDAAQLDLSKYAAVVLNNPGELETPIKIAVTDYVNKGGSALIAVGPAAVRAGDIPIAGNKVSSTTANQGAAAKASEIFSTDVFENVQFLATPRITPDSTERTLATFTDGSPLLLEQTKGEGKVLILAGTLDNSTSDFPVHAGYLPFVAATGAYLTGETDDVSTFVVGSAIALRQSKAQSASADVIGPDGNHEFPLSDATRILTFNPTREGFYDVHPANGRRRLVAVHADRRESNLEKVPQETLILWRNTSNGGAVAAGAAPESTTIRFSLWRYFLTLLLIAAIFESIFATRYLSEERQQQS